MTIRFSIIVIVLVFLALIYTPYNVYSAAWTQSRGSTQIITSLNKYTDSSAYNINGNKDVPDNTFHKYEINPFIEYGLTRDTTIGVNPLFQNWQVKNGNNKTSGQIFESELFMRKKLLALGNSVVSIQPLIKIPCIPVSGSLLIDTCDSYDIELRLLAGYGFKMEKKLSDNKMRPFAGQYHFLNFETAYRLHTDGSSDVLKNDGTIGFRYNENILVMGQAFTTIAINSDTTTDTAIQKVTNRYANVKLQLSGVIQTSNTTSMQIGFYAGVYSPLAENDLKLYNGITLAIWKRF